MMKYLEYIEIIPIAILTMLFTFHKEKEHHNVIKSCKKTCIKIVITLLVISFLLFMLVHTNINKYVIFIISVIMWVILFLIKSKYSE